MALTEQLSHPPFSLITKRFTSSAWYYATPAISLSSMSRHCLYFCWPLLLPSPWQWVLSVATATRQRIILVLNEIWKRHRACSFTVKFSKTKMLMCSVSFGSYLPCSCSNWVLFLSTAPLRHGQRRWFHQIHPLRRGSWHRVYNWWYHRGHSCHSETGQRRKVTVHPESTGSGQTNRPADGTRVWVHHQNPRHQWQWAQVPGRTLCGLCSRNVTCG